MKMQAPFTSALSLRHHDGLYNQKGQIEEGLSRVGPIIDEKKEKGCMFRSSAKKMRAAQFVGKFVNPVIGLLFVIGYWAYGLLFLRV